MDQRNFDFSNDQSHEIYLQLDDAHKQSIVDLMALLIINVYQTQEDQHEPSPTNNEDQT